MVTSGEGGSKFLKDLELLADAALHAGLANHVADFLASRVGTDADQRGAVVGVSERYGVHYRAIFAVRRSAGLFQVPGWSKPCRRGAGVR